MKRGYTYEAPEEEKTPLYITIIRAVLMAGIATALVYTTLLWLNCSI